MKTDIRARIEALERLATRIFTLANIAEDRIGQNRQNLKMLPMAFGGGTSPAGPSGQFYVADKTTYAIFRLNIAGIVDCLAIGVPVVSLMAFDASNNMFVRSQAIIKLDTSGNPTFVKAGSLAPGTFDTSGNRYDFTPFTGLTIYSTTPLGVVTTFATLATAIYGITIDASNNVYAGGGTHIYKITPSGTVTTITAALSNVWTIAIDSSGNLFSNNGGNIAKTTPAGVISTFYNPGAFVDWIYITIDSGGNIFASQNGALTIHKITPGGTNSTFATLTGSIFAIGIDTSNNVCVSADSGGGGKVVYKYTPGGTRTTFSTEGLGQPTAIAFDGTACLYIVDNSHSTIVKRTLTSQTTFGTLSIPLPDSMIVDSTSNLYVAAAAFVYKYTSLGVRTTFASGLSSARGLTLDSVGNLFVSDAGVGIVYKVTPSGTRTTFATGFTSPDGLAIDASDNVYVADNTGLGRVSRITPGGVVSVYSDTSAYFSPTKIAFGPDGYLYATSGTTSTVWAISASGSVAAYTTSNGIVADIAFGHLV